MNMTPPQTSLSMPDPKRAVLRSTFGFPDFRPGQETVIDTLLAGQHVLTVMPTGSGKSLCYQVPALVTGGLTIVVSPLVALMQDQVAALKLAGVAAETINSSRSRAENVAAWRRVAAGETRLLYMAPERLMTDRMLVALAKRNLRLIAVDEAHCISQWGPAFRPEYEALSRLREQFPGIPIAALTATADAVTREDIANRLFGMRVQTVVLGFDRPNIRLSVAQKTSWKTQMLTFLERHQDASGIVYCLSRRKTEEVASLLANQGFMAFPYHAGMDQQDREDHQNRFMTEPGVIIVATIAFGMGIDKSDLRFVLHVDLPATIEAYYQEIGRAGRDGAPAEAHMIYGLSDIRMRRKFIEDEEAGLERMRREHKRLDALIAYCEAPECRRRSLLSYFGEATKACGNCDVCIDPVEITDGTVFGRKVAKAIHGSGQRFGPAYIIDILRGARTARIQNTGHDELTVFGVGADLSKPEWQSIIRQLVASGFLSFDIEGYGGLKFTPRGQDLLNGKEEFRYRPDRRSSKPPRTERRSDSVPEAETGVDAGLLTALRELRLEIARERKVPAYLVFSDRSLIDMARYRPLDQEAFSRIHGVGAVKLQDFADSFITAIAAHEA